MKKKNILILLAIFLLFTACNIDRFPYDSMASEKIMSDPDGSIQSLINGIYAQTKTWSDPMYRCGEYAGDNMMIRGTSTNPFYEFISYSRTPQNARLMEFWDRSYKVIAQSSNIIKMNKEGKSAKIDNQLGECYFLRGMMYFYLVRAFGRPYAQNPDKNLGVPIVNGTPDNVFGELPDRSTVQATYTQVIQDLEKAISLLTINNGNIFASKEAAQALLSRVYLYMSGTYDTPNVEYAKLAIKYADEVIKSGKYSLLSRTEFMKYNTFKPENNKETIFAIKRVTSEFPGSSFYTSIGGMYANIGGMGWGEMYASAKYLDLLNETGRNDWFNGKIVDARAAFIEPQYTAKPQSVFRFIKNVYNTTGAQTNYNYVQAPITKSASTITCKETETGPVFTLTPVDVAQGIYSITYTDGITYTGVIDQLMILNRAYPMFYVVKCSREGEESHLHSPVVTRLAEVYLNKAEAEAKTGNYAAALLALNTIRERSLPEKGYTDLNAGNAADRIDKERQLELAFQAERSYDAYRNGKVLTRKYPGPHNPMEVIQPTDYRAVFFIPQDAINSYPGKLTQNPISN